MSNAQHTHDLVNAVEQANMALEEALADFEHTFDPEFDDEPGWVSLARQVLEENRAAIAKSGGKS